MTADRLDHVVRQAQFAQYFRYQTLRQLVERNRARPAPTLRSADPAIRPMTHYTLEERLS